jgi:hypothetical protein
VLALVRLSVVALGRPLVVMRVHHSDSLSVLPLATPSDKEISLP